MFHHYSVRPFVTLCRRALCGCLLLLLTVPAAWAIPNCPPPPIRSATAT